MITATHEEFRTATTEARVRIIETSLTDWILATRPGQPAWFDGQTRLADLAIDSIQLVELKFALDQLIGMEIDVNVFITNPTVHELAGNIAAIAV